MIRTPFASIFLAVICLFLLAPDKAGAATYTIVGDMAGAVTEYTVKEKDTLYKIARQHDIGIVEIMTANPGVDPWVPTVGSVLTMPTAYVLPTVERKGIVIDLSSLRLFYFPANDKNTVMTFPLGIGMDGWATPMGVTKIMLKREHPTWIAPESIIKEDPEIQRVVPPGPDNPLGDYAMNLGIPGYRIHGTNKPYGIGRRSSHGCMRMYPEDIETLFKMVEVGTPVTIMQSEYKIGWSEGTLYLQATPSQEQADEIFEREELTIVDMPGVYGDLSAIAGEHAEDIDWDAVRTAARWRSGIPIAITAREVASTSQQEFAPVR